MSIELTTEQSQALACNREQLIIIDPNTNLKYRLIPEDIFTRLQSLLIDETTWNSHEMALLAGIAFGKLDNIDYSEYLDNP